MTKGQVFRNVATAPSRRSRHNKSQARVFTGDFGQLYPVYCEELLPGDTFHLTFDGVVRFQPLVAPVMHEITLSVHYFFVPYRLYSNALKDLGIEFNWEDFITGGKNGDDEQTPPLIPINTWTAGHLYDFLYQCVPPGTVQNPYKPIAFPPLAYNLIYNEYYRDENLIEEVDILNSTKIHNRAWTKDYFTSALPFQQRGVSPSIPIASTGHLDWTFQPDPTQNHAGFHLPFYIRGSNPSAPDRTPVYIEQKTSGEPFQHQIFTTETLPGGQGDVGDIGTLINSINGQRIADSLKLTMDAIADWDINDLRTAWQIQRYLEAMARIGSRYTEFIQGIWNKNIGDKTLQRPEYVGGARSPVVISEVLQTSETTKPDSPQGNMAGHGITASSTRIGTYHAQEYGILMGILSVMPKPSYHQGMSKRWTSRTRYDYPNPYFMHLSEQPIKRGELYFTGTSSDDTPFGGWQGIWDEYRISHDTIHGLIRTPEFEHWSLSRTFANAPTLNQSFIECDAITGGSTNPLKRCFAVPEEPGLIITAATRANAIRPIPFIAEPGYVDH